MNILFVIGSLGGGGAEKNIIWLAKKFADIGYNIRILTICDNENEAYEIPSSITRVKASDETTIEHRWFDLIKQYKKYKSLRYDIIANNPDLVISFIDTCNLQVLISMIFSKVKIIVSERTDWRIHRINRRWKILRRILYPTASKVVCLSKPCFQDALSYKPKWRCAYIPNAVQKPKNIKKHKLRKKIIVCMSRLIKSKRVDHVISAFSKIVEKHDGFELIVIGFGPELSNLKKLCEKLKILHKVKFTGWINDPFPILEEAYMFLFASKYEAFGMVILEALCVGVPVVSYRYVSDPSILITDNVNGFLVEDGSISAMSEKALLLIENNDLHTRMSNECYKITNQFNEEKIFKMWSQIVI